MGDSLIYGATGYTGQLIAEHAAERGLNPVLAGRRAYAVSSLAGRLALRHRVFDLEGRQALAEGLSGMTAVLHAAGPFSTTAKPMADACLAAGVHYCDITGEIDVIEDMAARDKRAKAAGVMLMPSVGFDVVPSDCLAAHVATRLPNATKLRLSIGGLTRASRGTATTRKPAEIIMPTSLPDHTTKRRQLAAVTRRTFRSLALLPLKSLALTTPARFTALVEADRRWWRCFRTGLDLCPEIASGSRNPQHSSSSWRSA